MPVILSTDIIIYLLIAMLCYLAVLSKKGGNVTEAWRRIKTNRLAMVALFFLLVFGVIAFADSVRWRDSVTDGNGNTIRSKNGSVIYSPTPESLLDRAFSGLKKNSEKTFSAPFAEKQFVKETMEVGGKHVRDFPELKYPGSHPLGTGKVGNDVLFSALKGVRTGIVIGAGT
ncbi:MAG: hypothetical protein V3T30_02435, partial [Thermodesulfobacteriota bacterium]